MKKILLLLFFVFFVSKSVQASEEVVILEPSTRFFYDNPAPTCEIVEEANKQESLFDDETIDLSLDEEFTNNKVEKVFTKFINNRIQNRGINLISAPINY